MFKKIFLCGIIAFLVFLPYKSNAQFPGEGVTVSPPILEKNVQPGEIVTETINLSNPTKKLVELYPVVMNFKAKGEGGEPDFYLPTEEEKKFSLASWIKFSQLKIALTPEQVTNWTFQIAVPQGAEPGGHYGVILFATEPPKIKNDTTTVGIASMVGSLILCKVAGEVVEKGVLQEFSTKKFYFKPPVKFTVRIANTGNVHFKPQGEIVIKNWQGKNIGEVAVNQSKGNVLPESTRKFEEEWNPKKIVIGRFKSELQLAYGESGKTLEGDFYFWVVPLWVIIIAVLLLLLLIVVILVRVKRKSKNRIEPKIEPNKKIIIR